MPYEHISCSPLALSILKEFWSCQLEAARADICETLSAHREICRYHLRNLSRSRNDRACYLSATLVNVRTAFLTNRLNPAC